MFDFAPEYACDNCGEETPDGHGSYDEHDRRVCADCAGGREY